MKKRIGLPLTGVFLVVGLLVGFASEAVSTPQGEDAKITERPRGRRTSEGT